MGSKHPYFLKQWLLGIWVIICHNAHVASIHQPTTCINVTDNHKPYLISTEDNLAKGFIPPTQFHNNQGNVANSEFIRRTSNKQKNPPITRSKEFL